jgi:hypothetical protein
MTLSAVSFQLWALQLSTRLTDGALKHGSTEYQEKQFPCFRVSVHRALCEA